MNRQINDDKKVARRGQAAFAEKKRAASVAKARGEAAKRVAAVERAIAEKDALDDTPQPKLGRKMAVQHRQVDPPSEVSEAPSPRPSTTDTEAFQSEEETPKAKKTTREKMMFRNAVEEAELTDIEGTPSIQKPKGKGKGKGKAKEQPKPVSKKRPLVCNEVPLYRSPRFQVDSPRELFSGHLFTPKPMKAGNLKRSKDLVEVSRKLFSPSILDW